MSKQNQELTGYPSIDRPWLKYYSEEAKNLTIPTKTMWQLVYEKHKNSCDDVMLNYFDRKIAYGEFFENVRKTVAALSARGVRQGDVVAILSLNTPETIYCLYALNYLGAVANLLLASMTKQEIYEKIAETKSKMIFVLDKILERTGEVSCDVPVIVLSVADSAGGQAGLALKITEKRNKNYETFQQFIKSGAERIATEAVSDQLPAVIVYTSGTTGANKGVVLSGYNLNAAVISLAVSEKKFQNRENFLDILPPFTAFGIYMMHLSIYVGMVIIPVLIPEANIVMEMLKRHRPERLAIGPAITEVIERYKENDLSFLTDLIGGGGAISVEKERKLNEILKNKYSNTRYLSGYGMTELSGGVSTTCNNVYKEQSDGIPLAMINVKILDIANGKELGYEKEGELLVNSPGLMVEYFNRPQETAEVIEIIDGERWIHTGDLAKVDEDGFLFITGRLKRIYITKAEDGIAYKLFPQRLEEIVEQIGGVHKCGTIAVEDVEKEHVPVVFATLANRSDDKAEQERLEENVREKIVDVVQRGLPEYYQPKAIVVLEEIPVTSSQKVDYKKLEERYKELEKAAEYS